jgi:hypothetical protein
MARDRPMIRGRSNDGLLTTHDLAEQRIAGLIPVAVTPELPGDSVVGAALGQEDLLEVVARTEPGAGAGHHHETGRFVGGCSAESVPELGVGLGSDRIPSFGAVDGDPCGRTTVFVQNVRVSHLLGAFSNDGDGRLLRRRDGGEFPAG